MSNPSLKENKTYRYIQHNNADTYNAIQTLQNYNKSALNTFAIEGAKHIEGDLDPNHYINMSINKEIYIIGDQLDGDVSTENGERNLLPIVLMTPDDVGTIL